MDNIERLIKAVEKYMDKHFVVRSDDESIELCKAWQACQEPAMTGFLYTNTPDNGSLTYFTNRPAIELTQEVRDALKNAGVKYENIK